MQWLCAAAQTFLNMDNLAELPALMSGYGSLLDRPGMTDFAAAAFGLRQIGVSVVSDPQLRLAVHDFILWEEEHRDRPEYHEPPFVIDAEDPRFGFRLRAGADGEADRMAQSLLGPLPFEVWNMPFADPSRPMSVMEPVAEGAGRIVLDLSELPTQPPAPQYNIARPSRGPIHVPIAELEQVASRLDAMDLADPGRPRGNWLARIREEGGEAKFEVLAPDRTQGRLHATAALELSGLKHLIGLPGTGKSTLITLLLLWLDEHDYRAVVLLPSIEAALNLLADLRFYGADVGLLVGQSPETRINHARRLAERLGADDSRGFGRSAPGADLLGLTCALAAFDADDNGGDAFPHLAPPCNEIRQRGLKADGSPNAREGTHLCPLSGACGRMKAPRELATRRIWLGHVLSMDTRISPHFSGERIRYFEAAALAVDVVIVDEADGAQQALDRKAIASLDLTGSEESYDHRLVRDLFSPLSAGRFDLTAGNVQNYVAAATDFGELNRALVAHLQADLRRGDGGPVERFKDTFVTSINVLTVLFSSADVSMVAMEDRMAEETRFNAIRSFWDGCIRAAVFRRTDDDLDTGDYEYDREHVATAIGRSSAEVDQAALAIARSVRSWISEPLPTRRARFLDEAREATFGLIPPTEELRPAQRENMFRFLVGVTTVILQFLSLVPAQQAMVAEGIHNEPLFRQGISEDLARIVPEALLGRLAGLRFHHEEGQGRPGVRLQYVSFRGTPRVLLYRLHELFRHEGREAGPAVLLASATSFLEESPTFHIPTGPDLILRRSDPGRAWRDSRYVFAPIPDPENPSRPLRFSGAREGQRERVLRAMLDHYASGDVPRLVQMGQDFDPGRKVALVVNSYEQVVLAKDWLRRRHPVLGPRVVAVCNAMPERNDGDWITASQVERLGLRDDWDALIFPMKALSRGVNIVFERGPRRRDALIGTMVFLTRPHPATESLDLVAGLAGAQTLAFDMHRFQAGTTGPQATAAWRAARRELLRTVRRLLRFPLMASRLGPIAVPFTADIMVDVLQTIGRSMRNGCPTRVVFADAAWAPNSATGRRDTAETSMLVMMRDILRARLNAPDPVDREIYRALYEPFMHPLERCVGVRFPDGADDDE